MQLCCSPKEHKPWQLRQVGNCVRYMPHDVFNHVFEILHSINKAPVVHLCCLSACKMFQSSLLQMSSQCWMDGVYRRQTAHPSPHAVENTYFVFSPSNSELARTSQRWQPASACTDSSAPAGWSATELKEICSMDQCYFRSAQHYWSRSPAHEATTAVKGPTCLRIPGIRKYSACM